ncbi:hypothetical protein CRE_13231 [Caenorhabditis remanei]|uniref:Serpentine receptor class r-10 n=1 Tax=Caenorhabditis remanei TaxID=31234 RepID=E3NV67_CAERE|nr:hypothetical protein CRE_13231 [Caenorhabditis remanei]
MELETFRLLKRSIQLACVVFSLFVNSILIYLIIKKSPTNMGTYCHLIIYFCCVSIIFSILDIIVQPNVQTYKSAFFMVVEVQRRNMDPWIAKIATALWCFGVAHYCIAIHFIYRFFALERKGRVRYFQGFSLIIWFLIPIFSGAMWFLITAEVFTQTNIEIDYIRNIVKQTFSADMHEIVFVSGIFYPIDETGQRVINWRSFIGLGLYSVLMTIPFTVIIVFGFRSWKIVRGLLDHGESEYSKNLQMQLYKALVAQTILPMIFLFIPFGLLFSLPMFEIDCQFLSSFITLIFAMYPAVDPLPILYFIDYYRIPIIGLKL